MNILKLLLLIWVLAGCTGISHTMLLTEEPKVEEAAKVLKVDTSGMMVDYGGQLINKRQSLFCTHWDILGREVTFIARNGKEVKRIVIDMRRLGHDVCIITFNEELDPEQHWIAPVADLTETTEVTIFRYKDREPISVKVQPDFFYHGMWSCEHIVFKCEPDKDVRPGDSGKGWYAMIDGKIHLVGLNSYIVFDNLTRTPVVAFSAEVGEIYNPKHWELK